MPAAGAFRGRFVMLLNLVPLCESQRRVSSPNYRGRRHASLETSPIAPTSSRPVCGRAEPRYCTTAVPTQRQGCRRLQKAHISALSWDPSAVRRLTVDYVPAEVRVDGDMAGSPRNGRRGRVRSHVPHRFVQLRPAGTIETGRAPLVAFEMTDYGHPPPSRHGGSGSVVPTNEAATSTTNGTCDFSASRVYSVPERSDCSGLRSLPGYFVLPWRCVQAMKAMAGIGAAALQPRE